MYSEIKGKDGYKTITLNRRKAIHERCLDCSAWIPKEVAACTLTQCSLHPYRSGKGKQDVAKRQKAIRAYCLCCMNEQVGEITKCPSADCPLHLYRKGSIDKQLENYIRENSNSRAEISLNLI